MMKNVEEIDLKALGITEQPPMMAGAKFVPFSLCQNPDNLLFISGQGTRKDGKFQFIGKVGDSLSLADGIEAARICAKNVLAQLYAACQGDLSRITRVHRLTGYVNAAPDFLEVSKVINGASELLVEVLGPAGAHARTALGVATLPNGMAVEVEAIAEIRP